jgi:large subunit ribosomal protein L24
MIKKGDTVYIRTGSSKGKTGRVLAVNPKKQTVLVEGINKVHRHQRPTQKNPQGGIITREQPIHISNVALVVQTAEGPKPTRAKKQVIDEGGKGVKVRISRLTGEQI